MSKKKLTIVNKVRRLVLEMLQYTNTILIPSPQHTHKEGEGLWQKGRKYSPDKHFIQAQVTLRYRNTWI